MQTDYKKYLPEGELRCGTIPADIFCTVMILQKEKPVSVWGTADPGNRINVRLQ